MNPKPFEPNHGAFKRTPMGQGAAVYMPHASHPTSQLGVPRGSGDKVPADDARPRRPSRANEKPAQPKF